MEEAALAQVDVSRTRQHISKERATARICPCIFRQRMFKSNGADMLRWQWLLLLFLPAGTPNFQTPKGYGEYIQPQRLWPQVPEHIPFFQFAKPLLQF